VSDLHNHSEYTYIRRRGRTTKAQAHALEKLIDNYRVVPAEILSVAESSPLGIEIGFGMGHALFEWAQAAPDWQLFGIELYQPGIGALVHRLHSAEINNVHILEVPAQQVIAQLPECCVDEVRIFFPDPWPKKRHHKRRLIQPEFINDLTRVLKPLSLLRIATDWAPYAAWIRECLQSQTGLQMQIDHVRAAASEATIEIARQSTNFEKRGERLGHDIHDLVYVKNSATTESR
jgi:tRNA (guanine-N7-)-methyltransferase